MNSVLIVEDNKDVSNMLVEALNDAGYLTQATLNNLLYQRYEEASSGSESELHSLIQRYGYSFLHMWSKIDFWEVHSVQGGFSLFIMGFVSILFLFCILTTYCFKVFLSKEKDMIRFDQLKGIGILEKEKESLINTRIRLMMFVPTVLGIIIELGFSYALNIICEHGDGSFVSFCFSK